MLEMALFVIVLIFLNLFSKNGIGKIKVQGKNSFLMSYYFYLKNSTPLKRMLSYLVLLAFLYVFFGGGSEILKNISYSLIAAFIFDLFINYEKDATLRLRAVRSIIPICNAFMQRSKILEAIISDNKKSSIIKDGRFVFNLIFTSPKIKSNKQYDFIWYFDSNGIKKKAINIGDSFDNIILEILKEDFIFFNSLYNNSDIINSLPSLNDTFSIMNNLSGIVYNMIDTKLGKANIMYATDDLLIEKINDYLKQRLLFEEVYNDYILINQ
ncbi:hypothetical protein [Pantoea ananatis]|uniref:hypothetical protein n=1 Tax=Pantoea ananas TaxID=553 RepID=UPI001B302F47|nr:hypothetical protein [Pantoea ananatis]